jgi:hypothetical protein
LLDVSVRLPLSADLRPTPDDLISGDGGMTMTVQIEIGAHDGIMQGNNAMRLTKTDADVFSLMLARLADPEFLEAWRLPTRGYPRPNRQRHAVATPTTVPGPRLPAGRRER